MSKFAQLAAMGMLFTATSCATPPKIGDLGLNGSCGGHDENVLWRLSEPPENADDYRQSALDSHPYRSKRISNNDWGYHKVETWFALDTGDFLLCRSSDAPHKSFGVTWWTFKPGSTDIADSGATVVVG